MTIRNDRIKQNLSITIFEILLTYSIVKLLGFLWGDFAASMVDFIGIAKSLPTLYDTLDFSANSSRRRSLCLDDSRLSSLDSLEIEISSETFAYDGSLSLLTFEVLSRHV